MNPTAELADIVLPVASCSSARRCASASRSAPSPIARAAAPAVVPPPGEARSDIDIIFDLAAGLGLGEHFWNGDVEAAYRYQLDRSGVNLEALRAEPRGIRVVLTTRYAKHAEPDAAGSPRGFPTPSRKVEFWSETILATGMLPCRISWSRRSARRRRTARYPLVLTCAKPTLFCRPRLARCLGCAGARRIPKWCCTRGRGMRGIAAGDWVSVETRRARCARAPCSTQILIRAWRLASMAGGRPVRR